jgi:hypothetical protein
MAKRKPKPKPKSSGAPSAAIGSMATGLAILVGLLLVFSVVYVAAIQATIQAGDGDFRRAYLWTGYLISGAALVAIFRNWPRLTGQMGTVGFTLAGWVWLSTYSRADINTANVEAAFTLLAFFGGSVLLPRQRGVRVALLHRDHWVAVVQALWLGIRVSLPLALMTAAYLILSEDTLAWRNPILALGWAIQPAIAGEVAFRFFIINLCLTLLATMPARRPLVVGIFIMAVLPYGLLSVSGMWVTDPAAAIVTALINSLLFGLPAAYLQWRRTLEAAIGFRLVIESLRTWAGILF